MLTSPQLHLGDCLDVMCKMETASVDMVFCDLPYGTTQNKWDIVVPFETLWEEYNRVIKLNGAVLLMGQAPFDKVLACSNLRNFRYEWIWEKNKATGHLNAKKMPMKCHENILVFYQKLCTYNPQKTQGHKPMNAVLPKDAIPEPDEKRNYNHVSKRLGNPGGTTERCPRDVIKFPVINNDSSEKWHPTQKPVQMVEYFINTYSNPGDVVLDNCMGSGTTGIACKNTGRQFIGIEKNPDYFKLAQTRINTHVHTV